MKFCIYTIVLFFFWGCRYEPVELPEDTILEELLNENADSLAFLLEEEIDPRALSAEDRINYTWWLANTHRKQNRSLVNDSMIHQVLAHYKEIGSPRLLKTYMLAANQAISNSNTQLYDSLVNVALDFAIEHNNTDTVIGLLYNYRNMDRRYEDDNNTCRLEAFLKEHVSSDKASEVYYQLSRLLRKSNRKDSLNKYIQSGIDAAIMQNKPRLEYALTRLYCDVLIEEGRTDKALTVLDALVKKMPVGQGVTGNEIYFNYIITLIAQGKYDSAKVYINEIEQLVEKYGAMIDPSERYTVENLLQVFNVVINVKQGKAFVAEDIVLIDNAISIARIKESGDKEKLFAQNKLQRDKLNLEIEKSEMRQRLLWVIIFVLVAVTVLVLVYQRKLLGKERNLRKTKELLRTKSVEIAANENVISKNEELIQSLYSQIDKNEDLKEDIRQLEKENEDLKDKTRLLQKDIESSASRNPEKDKELLFLENLSVENAKLIRREQFLTAQLIAKTKELRILSEKPSFIDEQEWYEIIRIVDQLFDGFSVRLHIDYPNLTEEDIRFCCLFKLNLSHSTIATLMGISPSSVTKRKQRIKEKMAQHLPDSVRKNYPLESMLRN